MLSPEQRTQGSLGVWLRSTRPANKRTPANLHPGMGVRIPVRLFNREHRPHSLARGSVDNRTVRDSRESNSARNA